VVEVVSVFPTTTEPAPGVIEVTEVAAWLTDELPVWLRSPVAVTPLISYIETEPATVVPKAAVIVSAPEDAAVVYHT
jgi:hypothetical protein